MLSFGGLQSVVRVVGKVDEASMNISNIVEHYNLWIWALEAWASWHLRIMTKGFEIGVNEGVDLDSGIKYSRFPKYGLIRGGTLLSFNVV